MDNFTITIFLESQLPILFMEKWWCASESLYDEFNDFEKLFKIRKDLADFYKFKFSLSEIDRPFEQIEKVIEKQKNSRNKKYIKIETYITPNEETLREVRLLNKDLTHDDCISLIFNETVSEIKKSIFDLILAANISKPGSLSIKKIYFYEGSEFLEQINGLHGEHFSIYEEKKDNGNWPPIKNLPLAQTINWLKGVPGFEASTSNSPVGRALSSLTYILTENPTADETPNLFWAMLGLEALYCSGGKSIQNELIEKAETFLGKRTTHKKKFGQLYNFRSRFIHGDVNLPYSYTQNDGSAQYKKYQTEKFPHIILAISILISTIQKLIETNSCELNFKYVLNK